MDSFRWTASAECPNKYSDVQLQMGSFSCTLKWVLKWTASAEYLSECTDGQHQLNTWVSTQMDTFTWTASAEYLSEYSDGQLQMDRFSWVLNWVMCFDWRGLHTDLQEQILYFPFFTNFSKNPFICRLSTERVHFRHDTVLQLYFLPVKCNVLPNSMLGFGVKARGRLVQREDIEQRAVAFSSLNAFLFLFIFRICCNHVVTDYSKS